MKCILYNQGWSSETKFIYYYQWAFFFAGFSFVSSMLSAVTNIGLYMRRYSTLDDMVAIIPGLEEYSSASSGKLPPTSRDVTVDKMDTMASFWQFPVTFSNFTPWMNLVFICCYRFITVLVLRFCRPFKNPKIKNNI